MSGEIQSVTLVEEVTQTVTFRDHDLGTTTLINGEERVVEIDEGVVGPPGGTGPQSSPLAFSLVGVSSFTATHSFDWQPQVWFIDENGSPIMFTPQFPDSTHVHIQFPRPFTGTMYVR